MQNPDKIESAAEQVARRLVQDLENATWTETLPGLKTLAQRYSVSHQTVNKAMSFLELWGWIEPALPRKPRHICEARATLSKATTSTRNLLILHSQEIPDADSSIYFRQQLAIEWTKYYEDYTIVPVSTGACRSVEKELDRLIRKHGAQALLLNNMPLQWGEAALDRLPTYFAGGALPIDRPVNDFSMSLKNELKKSYKILRTLGHQRILLVYTARGIGIQKLVQNLPESPKPTDNLIGLPADYCVRIQSFEPDAWERMWTKELNRLRPTAIITLDPCAIASFYSYCYRNKINIPADHSILCLDHVKELEYLSPKPQMLQYNFNAHLKHFERWLQSGLKDIGQRIEPLEWDPNAASIADLRNQ